MEIGAYICLVLVFVFIILGSPTFLGFGLFMAVAAVFFMGLSLSGVASDLYAHVNSFTLLAIPLFIYCGNLMTSGDSSKYLMEFINSLVRQFKGGLGNVVILSCGFFAAMCGSGIATAAAIGMVTHKTLVEKGYSKEWTAAMIAAGAQLGPIIPPSIAMIVYCTMAEQNVAEMFMAGFIPGILLMIIFCIVVWLRSSQLHVATVPAATWPQRGSSFTKAIPALMSPFIILGGIYSGIFTPTEAAAVACVWAFLIGIFVYKGLNSFKKGIEASRDAAYATANIGVLIATALILGSISSRLGIPAAIASFITGMHLGPLAFLYVFCVLLIILGLFLDAFCIVVITVPMLLPASQALGINSIHFGMVLIFGLGIGQLTPPLGITLFTVAKFTNQPSGPVFKAVTPLTMGFIFMMFVVATFPQITLFLPDLLLS